jgi:hypothetical protein
LHNKFLIDWCKIFGSNNNNDTHYTRLLDTRIEHNRFDNYKDCVVNHICAHCGISCDEFNSISKKIKKSRDKFASHIEIDNIPEIPFLNDGINVLIGYVDFLGRFDADTLLDNEIAIIEIEEHLEFFQEELASFAGWPLL